MASQQYTPQMSLKTIDFKPVAFTPVQYNEQPIDYSSLARSIAMNEQRRETANTKIQAQSEIINKFRDTLNPEDYNWFDNLYNTKLNEAKEQMSLGNIQNAGLMISNQINDILTDNNLANKRSANALYQTEKNKIESGKYNDITKLRWKEVNRYYDNGTGQWEASWRPVEDIDDYTLYSKINALASETTRTTGNTTTKDVNQYIDSNGNKITIDSSKDNLSDDIKITSTAYKSGYTKSNQNTVHFKTKEKLNQTLRDLIAADDSINMALGQRYDNLVWAYNNAINRSNDMSLSEDVRKQASIEAERYKKNITNKDGLIISDYDTWIDNKIVPMFTQMEYYNTSDINSNASSFDIPNDVASKNQKALAATNAIVSENVETQGTQLFKISTYADQQNEIKLLKQQIDEIVKILEPNNNPQEI